MIKLNVSQDLRKQTGIVISFGDTIREAVLLLRWEEKDCSLSIKLKRDFNLPLGNGRVLHKSGIHLIRLHPRPDRPFPWNTVRHEAMHALLKSKIRAKLNKRHCVLPVPTDYSNQTIRENLEEYAVRILNAVHVRQSLGNKWYKSQVDHEVKNGFVRMLEVSKFIEVWRRRNTPFSKQTFIDLIRYLNKKASHET